MPALFDAHCHLDPDSGSSSSAPTGEAAAGRILCGVGPGDWEAIARVGSAWPGTVAAYGLHPWHVGEAAGDWLAILRRRLEADDGAWLGEAGLDGVRTEAAPMERQDEVFRRQLALAGELGRPANLHCVKAWPELLAALDAGYAGNGLPFIVHSFGGPHQFIVPLAERGAYFTIGPLTTRRDSRRARERTARLPADRLLLESDAFLHPGRDAVADLASSLAWLADVLDMERNSASDLLADNLRRLFDHDHQ